MKPAAAILIAFAIAVFPAIIVAQNSDSTYTDNFSEDETNTNETKKWKLEPLLGYTFSNRGGWANITPEIFLGFDTLMYCSPKGRHSVRFRFGPTVSSMTSEIDSANIFRTIMLPGPANLSLNTYYTYSMLDGKLRCVNMIGTSLKMMGTTADNQSLTQNNIKFGTGLEVFKLFMVSAEHTWAWHNITNESEETFRNTFNTCSTHVRYFTLTVESYSQAMDLFLVFTWRKFLSKANFTDAYLNDTKIVSLGIRKDMNLLSQPGSR